MLILCFLLMPLGVKRSVTVVYVVFRVSTTRGSDNENYYSKYLRRAFFFLFLLSASTRQTEEVYFCRYLSSFCHSKSDKRDLSSAYAFCLQRSDGEVTL